MNLDSILYSLYLKQAYGINKKSCKDEELLAFIEHEKEMLDKRMDKFKTIPFERMSWIPVGYRNTYMIQNNIGLIEGESLCPTPIVTKTDGLIEINTGGGCITRITIKTEGDNIEGISDYLINASTNRKATVQIIDGESLFIEANYVDKTSVGAQILFSAKRTGVSIQIEKITSQLGTGINDMVLSSQTGNLIITPIMSSGNAEGTLRLIITKTS